MLYSLLFSRIKITLLDFTSNKKPNDTRKLSLDRHKMKLNCKKDLSFLRYNKSNQILEDTFYIKSFKMQIKRVYRRKLLIFN